MGGVGVAGGFAEGTGTADSTRLIAVWFVYSQPKEESK